MSVKRGQIYFIKKGKPAEGSEQRAERPGVIVSNNANNAHSDVYEVVFMTTKPKTDLPTHFTIESALKTSLVLCEQINSVHKDRIGTWIGTLSEEEMKELDKCLAVSVGLQKDVTAATPCDDDLKQQLAEVIQKMQIAEKQAATYKEMYEFLLQKRLRE